MKGTVGEQRERETASEKIDIKKYKETRSEDEGELLHAEPECPSANEHL